LRSRLAALLALLLAATASAEARVRVALLPLVVHSGEGREYLQKGLADMLVSRLGSEPRLAVVPVEDPKAATIDAESARKTGAAQEADYVVYGSFTRFGEGASVHLLCAPVRDAEREPRDVYVHSASMAELIPQLDGAARRVAYTVLGGAPPDAAVSTAPEAPPDREAEPVR
jgi:outer membrane protein insertion porin family